MSIDNLNRELHWFGFSLWEVFGKDDLRGGYTETILHKQRDP